MKTVYLIHGWEGYPDNNWFPWLKAKLIERGFEVVVPAMPNPDNPKRAEWVEFLEKLIPNPDAETFFVGHSMGCRAILRYLEDLPANNRIGGAVLVAGWVRPNWEGKTEDETRIIEDWVEPPMDFEKVRTRSPHFTAIFSDDDPYVPKENVEAYQNQLKAKTIILHAKGHFSDSDNVKELPEVLDSLMEMTK